ncbi:MAG: TIGR00295 family protein [Candidatus Thermoplasmatota archaeon]|nr:TIGR00295 family protein [Candidatus Thermoplasmatota archaeon]
MADDEVSILRKTGCADIVIEHCRAVRDIAEIIANRLIERGYSVDLDLVLRGAMLHDIGRCRTNGIKHAVAGAQIARELGLDKRIIRIIERHIGGGLDREDARALRLPEGSYMPETIEEKIVCHADNLIATTERQSVEREIEALRRKELTKAAERVRALHEELSSMCRMDIDDLIK